MRENPHETARGHRGSRRSEAGEVAPLLPRGSRVDCGVSDSGRGAEAATKNATRKLYFWVLLWVYREVCSERTALAPVILCQNRFWNFCGGVGGSAGAGEVIFGWFWVQGSGQVWGVVERLMMMTKGRIWG